jgi:hypothetical protein
MVCRWMVGDGVRARWVVACECAVGGGDSN